MSATVLAGTARASSAYVEGLTLLGWTLATPIGAVLLLSTLLYLA